MKTKALFLLATLSVAVVANAAEKEFYQIYRVEPLSQNIKATEDEVLYEDANCQIRYDFWDDNGDAGFIFTNKTNEFITIDLTKTFFVQNGYSYSYFLNRVSSSSSSGNIVTTDAGQEALAGVANALLLASDIASASMGGNVYARSPITAPENVSTRTSSISYYEQPTIIIPAKCSVSVGEYSIKTKVFRDCLNLLFPKKKEVTTTTYTKDNTPFWFGNVITYRFDKGEEIVVQNSFYVKSITNKPENLVREFSNKSSVCPDKKADQGRYVFLESYADGFFIKYDSGIRLY